MQGLIEIIQKMTGGNQNESANEAVLATILSDAGAQVVAWLRELGARDMIVPWSAENLRIFGASNFLDSQFGYSSEKNGDRGWRRSWYVIAEISGDPVILDVAESPAVILFARHGQGKWHADQFADSLEVFMSIIEAWCQIFYHEFSGGILDENLEIKNEVIARFLEKTNGVVSLGQQQTLISMICW